MLARSLARSLARERNQEDKGKLTEILCACTCRCAFQGGEGKEDDGAGKGGGRYGGLSVELDPYGPGYDMSESGMAFNMDGFIIRESGITKVPDNFAKPMGRSNMSKDLLRLEILGRGASGVVYKAIHVPTLRIVAVKQIPVYEDDKRQQMVNELKALYTNLVPIEGDGATTHRGGFRAGPCPHIVAFHDTFSNMEDGNISIVVEFMDGGCRFRGMGERTFIVRQATHIDILCACLSPLLVSSSSLVSSSPVVSSSPLVPPSARLRFSSHLASPLLSPPLVAPCRRCAPSLTR